MRRALLAALAWLAFAWPALAAIGTPATLKDGGHYTGSSTTDGLTTNVDALAGSLIVVPWAVAAASTTHVTVDSALNCTSYTLGSSYTANTDTVVFNYCNVTAADLLSTGTITTTNSNAGNHTTQAFKVTGIATSSPVDLAPGTGVTGTAATAVAGLSTGTLGQASELLLACVSIKNGATGDNYTEDTGNGWTAFTVSGSSTNLLFHCAYQIVAATTSVAWAPTWTNGRTYSANLITFKAAAGGAVTVHGLLLLGVGP